MNNTCGGGAFTEWMHCNGLLDLAMQIFPDQAAQDGALCSRLPSPLRNITWMTSTLPLAIAQFNDLSDQLNWERDQPVQLAAIRN